MTEAALAERKPGRLNKDMRPATSSKPKRGEALSDPYRQMWMELSPAARLRRSWRMRSRVKNLQAVHDAKSLPKL